MAERNTLHLFNKIVGDVMEALRLETDARVFRWIYDGAYNVGEYIEYTREVQNHTIFEESQRLKQLDMQKYTEFLHIDCANLLSPHKPPAAWRLRRTLDTNPYII